VVNDILADSVKKTVGTWPAPPAANATARRGTGQLEVARRSDGWGQFTELSALHCFPTKSAPPAQAVCLRSVRRAETIAIPTRRPDAAPLAVSDTAG
jgi:hypothetical protein